MPDMACTPITSIAFTGADGYYLDRSIPGEPDCRSVCAGSQGFAVFGGRCFPQFLAAATTWLTGWLAPTIPWWGIVGTWVLTLFLSLYIVIRIRKRTPRNLKELIAAIETRDAAQVRLLLDRGLDVNREEGKTGKSPIMFAAKVGDAEICIMLLLAGADAGNAARHADHQEIRDLLETMPNVIKAVKEKKFDSYVFRVNSFKGTIGSDYYEADLKLWLAAGVDPNARLSDYASAEGVPPLVYAVKARAPVAVRLLLEAGANSDFKMPNGQTFVDYADKELRYDHRRDEIIGLLKNTRGIRTRTRSRVGNSVPSPRVIGAKAPANWIKGEPNPISKEVTRFAHGAGSSGVNFLCPTCSSQNTALDSQIHDVTGVLVKCAHCGNVSHVPSAYKAKGDMSGLSVHGGVRVPIAEFGDWMFGHPLFSTADAEIYGSYGLWGLCAGCHHRYASTVLVMFPAMEQFRETAFGAKSKESAEDLKALSERHCPNCRDANLITILVDIPNYVRDAAAATSNKQSW